MCNKNTADKGDEKLLHENHLEQPSFSLRFSSPVLCNCFTMSPSTQEIPIQGVQSDFTQKTLTVRMSILCSSLSSGQSRNRLDTPLIPVFDLNGFDRSRTSVPCQEAQHGKVSEFYRTVPAAACQLLHSSVC